jgi:phage gp29-like protein
VLWSITSNDFRNRYVSGLMTSCDWWILFALTGFKQYQVFADMFGMPLAIGYYEEGASLASRNALEDAVRGIGQDGYALLSALTEIVIKETVRGGDASTVYPQIMKICDAMLTKLITGGSLNTDVSSTGASR